MAKGVKFPSMLGGCAALLFFLLLADLISPGLGELIFSSLSPGSALLAKWLPVFFVPGLAMLPLAPSVGNGLEVCLDPNEIFLYNQRFQANFLQSGGAAQYIAKLCFMPIASKPGL